MRIFALLLSALALITAQPATILMDECEIKAERRSSDGVLYLDSNCTMAMQGVDVLARMTALENRIAALESGR